MQHKLKHAARCFAMQALYQWQMTQHDLDTLLKQFLSGKSIRSADMDFFQKLLKGSLSNITTIDALIQSHSERKLAALNPTELACLRMATYELQHCVETPYKVVIDEAVEITKTYGAENGHQYVNAVLDKIATDTRASEL